MPVKSICILISQLENLIFSDFPNQKNWKFKNFLSPCVSGHLSSHQQGMWITGRILQKFVNYFPKFLDFLYKLLRNTIIHIFCWFRGSFQAKKTKKYNSILKSQLYNLKYKKAQKVPSCNLISPTPQATPIGPVR